ncbi:hypothetical protein GH714_016590 [Hevea brasiliensis]|uniref:Uncharacterized protein n=1 Tax=Hevea brasiliensis TaxID=3981 RepID=A0A6A6L3P4_HEVBR|nr:hypothetical protein GH714_016590 [Hevea brasiliensis]
MATKYGFYFIVEGNTKRIKIPNHVIEMLDVFKFDMVTLSVKGLEGHSWQVAVGVDNGDGKFYLQDENLNNDSDSESLTIQPNFVSVMNTYDWKYKVNIPIQFAKEFLGLDDMLVDIHGTVLAEDDEVDFMLDVAANDDRVIFNTVITRSGSILSHGYNTTRRIRRSINLPASLQCWKQCTIALSKLEELKTEVNQLLKRLVLDLGKEYITATLLDEPPLLKSYDIFLQLPQTNGNATNYDNNVIVISDTSASAQSLPGVESLPHAE